MMCCSAWHGHAAVHEFIVAARCLYDAAFHCIASLSVRGAFTSLIYCSSGTETLYHLHRHLCSLGSRCLGVSLRLGLCLLSLAALNSLGLAICLTLLASQGLLLQVTLLSPHHLRVHNLQYKWNSKLYLILDVSSITVQIQSWAPCTVAYRLHPSPKSCQVYSWHVSFAYTQFYCLGRLGPTPYIVNCPLYGTEPPAATSPAGRNISCRAQGLLQGATSTAHSMQSRCDRLRRLQLTPGNPAKESLSLMLARTELIMCLQCVCKHQSSSQALYMQRVSAYITPSSQPTVIAFMTPSSHTDWL